MQKKTDLSFEELTSVSPLDGRYRKIVSPLAPYVSEYGLIKIRIEVEVKYLIALSEFGVIRKFSAKEKDILFAIIDNFSQSDSQEVKKLEEKTRHDVKAMERVLRGKIEKTTLYDVLEMIHFGLTSWDINNISYQLQIKRSVENVIVPQLELILEKLTKMSEENKGVVMLARTHGQAAVPTTLGHEIAVFAVRLSREIKKLKLQKLTGKLTGAVGNFNALQIAYPSTDWIHFSEEFVSSFGLEPNIFTTQINPYDDVAEYFQTFQRINNILIGFSQDVWRYISDEWFIQIAKKGEVGSSTMPQKVNPIDFENSEGNLGLANALFEFMARKLPVSRLQRDLSDSTVIRNNGTVLSFSLLGYTSLLKGFERIKPNLGKIDNDLEKDWTILAEAVQTILRKANVSDPYSMIATLSRGEHITKDNWVKWIDNLPIEDKFKKEIEKISPSAYIGLAIKITERAIKEIKKGR